MGVKVSVVEFDRDKAEEVLRQNQHNRPVRQHHVDRLARDMTGGSWIFTGQPIVISEAGILLDGQHRLHALSQSGVRLKFVVVDGVPSLAQEVMDSGIRRTPADALRLRGVQNYAKVAAAAKFLSRWEKTGTLVKGNINMPTTSEVMSLWERVPGLGATVQRLEDASISLKLPIGPVTAISWIAGRIDRGQADAWVEGLTTGSDLQAGDPILRLRETLIRDNGLSRRASLNRRTAWQIKAWNAFHLGQDLKRVYWDEDDPFPEMEGSEPILRSLRARKRA